MAFSKARRLSDFIAADGTIPTAKFASGTITSDHIADTSITHADLHTDMNLTSKTVLVANASTGDSDTTAANTAFVQQEIAALVDSSPSALNTLNELAAALGDDANFSTTVTNSIATKLPLAGGTMTGALTVNVTGSDVDAVTITGDNVTDFDFVANPPEFNLEDNSSTSGTKRARITVNDNQLQIAGLPDDDQVVSQYLFYGNLSNGNVGIGTDSPSGQLHVRTTDTTGDIRLGGGNGANEHRIFISAHPTAAYIDSYGGSAYNSLGIQASNLHLNSASGTGNVGIGTNNPTKSLSVKAPSGSNGGIDVFHSNGNKVAELVHHGSGDEGRLTLYDGGTNTVQIHGETGQPSYINSGNVGIGLTSPIDTKLVIKEVPATIVGGNAIHGSTMKGIKLISTLNGDESNGIWFGTNGSHWSGISGQRKNASSTWGTTLSFYTHEDATADLTYTRERMHISSEGYIEINSFSAQPDNTDTSTHRKIEIKANGSGQQTHKRDCFVQNNAGSVQYNWYKIILGSNQYGRGSNVKYTANWSTGHASGQGFMDGSFMCRARHDNSRIDVHGHIVYSRQVVTGTYYGWDYDPDITIYESNANGSGAGLYMRVQGSRTSGYDGATVHALYLEIFGSRQDTASQGIFQVGTSTPADVGSAISRTILS